MKGDLFINVFIAVLFEVFLAVFPCWLDFLRACLHPFPVRSLEEGNSLKVSLGCPDESCLSDWDVSGLEKIFTLLLAFEVLCHGH